MGVDYDLLSFMLSGKRRRKILNSLRYKVKTPKQIAEDDELSISNVSASLSELLEKGLVECLNPNKHIYKFFKITEKGLDALSLVEG